MNNSDIFFGVVEDRSDPLKLGRVRVRVVGLHTHDRAELPTSDLPWTYPIQSSTNASISGIGWAPVGVLPGTWVTVQFLDKDCQIPVILGTIGGIPPSKDTDLETYEFIIPTETTPTPVTDSSGNHILDGSGKPINTTEPDKSKFKSAQEFTSSQSAIEEIKKSEGFRSAPYQDGAGIWSIGYGTTFIGNTRVTQSTPSISKETAEAYLKDKVKTDFELAVKSSVRVPISQSMFDAMVSFAYNVGSGRFRKSSIVTSINTLNYEQAAENFLLYNKITNKNTGQLEESNGLTNRRKIEKALFLKEGIPTNTGEVKPTTESIKEAEKTNPTNTSNTILEEAQRGIFKGNRGFTDPGNKYPLKNLLGEPDTNRLARHEKIRDTMVYIKETSEHKNVPKAIKGTWNQSPTPYNSEYPFNKVFQSESGHFLEFDDTPDSERVNIHHKSGSFIEIDANGTQVNKIIGDGYVIMERNGYVHIIGSLDVCVEGAKTLRVEDTFDVEIHGVTTINIHNDAKLNIGGNAEIAVTGDTALTSNGKMDVNVGGDFNIKAGNFAVDAGNIHLNSGKASGTKKLNTISKKTPDSSSIGPLTVNSRKEAAGRVYETPDDGTKAQVEVYKEKRVAEGTATKVELETPPKIEQSKVPPENKVSEKNNPCGIPVGKKDFQSSDKLSKYYTLGDMTMGGARKVVDRVGLRADEIFCNLKALAENVMDPIKEKYPSVKINSGLREENTKSQHNSGQAVDLSFPGLTRSQLYDRVLEIQQLVPYDQMLLEYLTPGGNGWIHISYNTKGNRRQHFTMNNHSRVSPIGTFSKVS